jgi:3-phenylpropionate/cinnamic acid dioxygenase small subunit
MTAPSGSEAPAVNAGTLPLSPAPDDLTAFLYHEARLLDRGDLAAWLELFTDDAHYWIPARRGLVDPDRHVSIVYDDKSRLAVRVARLLSGKEYAQEPPSITCRQLSNVVIVHDDGLEAEVDGVQVTYETRPNTAAQVLPSHVTWRLRRRPDGIRIASKRVLLVDLDRYYENLTFII